jgi:hypothetical protein
VGLAARQETTMERQETRRIAFIIAAEITLVAIGVVGLAWFGADIVVRALRLTLIGPGV